MKPTTLRTLRYLLAVAVVVSIAGVLRWRAADGLRVDFDEGPYLRAAERMAVLLRAGSWSELSEVHDNAEHPQLAKLAFAVSIAPLGPADSSLEQLEHKSERATWPQPHFSRARQTSALFGTLEVLLLAMISPLAGLFLAIHTFSIKYSSQIMLEGLPALTSALAVVAYERGRVAKRGRYWLWSSAVCLGLSAAAKYMYGVVGIAIVIDWVWRAVQQPSRDWPRLIAKVFAWGTFSLFVFFACDPYLWPAPLERLMASLRFHRDYSQGSIVEGARYPVWQPLVWLYHSVWTNGEVFVVRLDWLIAALALLGLAPLWRARRVYVLWIAVGIMFLLLWPTKWPQYILTVSFPWSLAAAYGASSIWGWLRSRISRAKSNAFAAATN